MNIAQIALLLLFLYDFKSDKRVVFFTSEKNIFAYDEKNIRVDENILRPDGNILRPDGKYFIVENILVSVEGKNINLEIFLREPTESNSKHPNKNRFD